MCSYGCLAVISTCHLFTLVSTTMMCEAIRDPTVIYIDHDDDDDDDEQV